jgi:sterol desaturase/sphingolipid hydroxylase (fatty acid hydroxylase superfamily)
MPHQLQTFAVDVFRLCVWLILLAVVFVPLERLFALRQARVRRAGIGVDLVWYFVSSLIPGVILGVPMALVAWGVHRVVPGQVQAFSANLPLGLRIAASLVVGEIGFYWGHRWSHEIPFLWKFHALHHSAEHLDWLVNTRAHPVDMVFGKFVGLVPLYVLGLASPLSGKLDIVPLIVVLVGTIWGFFIHANVKWRFGFLESLIATPAFHHWHHTRHDHVDRNYASLLPFVDRLFGTWYVPRQWPTDYGTDHPVSARFHEQLIAPLVGRDPAPVPVKS